ncbi:MAG TPA: DUF3413 domain-containing protein, partial [Spirochaetota bacterium]|nr:DUF3413 domain-containing protein [Spirochaetota bacterium]
MKRLLFLFKHRSNDIINVRVLYLCGFFAFLHFAVCFCYLGDILSSGYKTIYKIHSITAFFSHSVFFAGIIAFLILLCARKLGDKAVSFILSSIITVTALLMIIDITLFRIYHFHINWYIISEITQPDFSRSSGIGISFFISSILEFLFAFLVITFLTFLILRAPRPRSGISFKRALKSISIIVIAVVLTEKIFMIAVSYNRPAYIYKLEDSMPVFYLNIGEYIYQPINSYLKIADKKESFDTITSEYANCRYP